MNFKEIKALDNENLVSAFYWIAVKIANEANGKGAITKKTSQTEDWLIKEMCSRFDLQYSIVYKEIHR